MKSSIYDYLLPYEGKTITFYQYNSAFFIGVGMSTQFHILTGALDKTVIIQKVLPDAIVIKVGVRPGSVFSSDHPAHTQIIPFGNMHISIADEKTAS